MENVSIKTHSLLGVVDELKSILSGLENEEARRKLLYSLARVECEIYNYSEVFYEIFEGFLEEQNKN